jgi:hypothetical protein
MDFNPHFGVSNPRWSRTVRRRVGIMSLKPADERDDESN